eukprot:scaffold216866_cov32-Tisochrysis_lutea.AAC.1
MCLGWDMVRKLTEKVCGDCAARPREEEARGAAWLSRPLGDELLWQVVAELCEWQRGRVVGRQRGREPARLTGEAVCEARRPPPRREDGSGHRPHG